MGARTRILVLLAAVATTAIVALLLLRGGAAEGDRWEAGPTGAGSARAPHAAPAPPPPGARVPPAAAETPVLEIRAVVAGEWGLARIQVLPAERLGDGTLEAWIGEDAPEGGGTDGDGRITFRYKAEPKERLFAVLADDAILEGAENAEPAGDLYGLRAFRAKSAAPVTLRYRDPDGLDLLRPVDASTGGLLAGREGIRIAWTVQEPGEEPEEDMEEPVEKAPGWLEAWDRDPSPRNLRLIVPGYLASPAPAGGWKGRTVLPLKADPGSVRGRILVPEGWSARAVLRGASDGRECHAASLAGVPGGPGTFAMGGVPAGEWELVVSATRGGRFSEEVSWAVGRFESRGTGIDLGDIRPLPGAVLRARVRDREGTPVPDARILLSLAYPGGIPTFGYARWHGGISMNLSWPGRGGGDEWQSEKDPGEEGWVEWPGLRPGATYLLASPRFPGLTRTVVAPSKPGETITVELDGRCPLTSCVLHFTVEGEEPEFWQGFSGPAYGDQFSTDKGILEAEIPPGRYRVAATAAPGPEPDYQVYSAEVEIPDSGRYEATVDLKPPKK